MNEYDAAVLRKNEIRAAGERSIVGLEPQTSTMQITSNQQLGQRVPASNPPHHRGSLLRTDDIDHMCTGVLPRPSTDVRGLDSLDGFIHADGRQVGQVDRVSERDHSRRWNERLRQAREALVNLIDAGVTQLKAHQLP